MLTPWAGPGTGSTPAGPRSVDGESDRTGTERRAPEKRALGHGESPGCGADTGGAEARAIEAREGAGGADDPEAPVGIEGEPLIRHPEPTGPVEGKTERALQASH